MNQFHTSSNLLDHKNCDTHSLHLLQWPCFFCWQSHPFTHFTFLTTLKLHSYLYHSSRQVLWNFQLATWHTIAMQLSTNVSPSHESLPSIDKKATTSHQAISSTLALMPVPIGWWMPPSMMLKSDHDAPPASLGRYAVPMCDDDLSVLQGQRDSPLSNESQYAVPATTGCNDDLSSQRDALPASKDWYDTTATTACENFKQQANDVLRMLCLTLNKNDLKTIFPHWKVKYL